MNLFEIATRNIKRNFYNYFIYFTSIVFNIIIYYTFSAIRYNQQVQQTAGQSIKVAAGFKVAAIIIAIFATIFIWYSTSFFLKKRKKEIALYSLLGIKKKEIGRMLFYENIVIGFIALFVGIILGSIFSKFFIMILIKFMEVNISIAFSLSLQAILNTTLVFGILFLLTSIHGYSIIYKYKLIDLFKAESVREKEPKVSIVLSVISLLIIVLGYVVGLKTDNGNFLLNVLLTTILVIIGTFGFFNYSLVYFIKRSKKNKENYYKGINMISTSNLLYRIKGNVRTFSIISILSATTLTSLGITYNLYSGIKEAGAVQYPYTFAYINSNEKIDEKVEDIIAKYPRNKKVLSSEAEFIKVNSVKAVKNKNGIYLISESEINRLLKERGVKEKFSIKNDGEAIILENYRDDKNYQNNIEEILSNGKKYSFRVVDKSNYSPLNYFMIGTSFIVKDNIYNKLYNENQVLRGKGYILENKDNTKELILDLVKNLPQNIELSSYYDEAFSIVSGLGIFMFVGVFIGLVFLISTGSIIYFKQLMEANEDKKRYNILRKVGVNKKEIRASIAKQIFIVFFIPLVLGISHSSVAIIMYKYLFNAEVLKPTLIIMGAYTFIYLIYYILTVNSYTKIVMEERN